MGLWLLFWLVFGLRLLLLLIMLLCRSRLCLALSQQFLQRSGVAVKRLSGGGVINKWTGRIEAEMAFGVDGVDGIVSNVGIELLPGAFRLRGYGPQARQDS